MHSEGFNTRPSQTGQESRVSGLLPPLLPILAFAGGSASVIQLGVLGLNHSASPVSLCLKSGALGDLWILLKQNRIILRTSWEKERLTNCSEAHLVYTVVPPILRILHKIFPHVSCKKNHGRHQQRDLHKFWSTNHQLAEKLGFAKTKHTIHKHIKHRQ